MPKLSSASVTSPAIAESDVNGIDLLVEDYKDVKSLFRKNRNLMKAVAPGAERQSLTQQMCTMPTVHAQIEEEIFYPAAHEVIPDEDFSDEAAVEHAITKDLIAQIQGMNPDEVDAKVKVLDECMDHYVKQEQDEMFPKIRRRMDIHGVGATLKARNAAPH